ncbi:head GIN domain-containing protein [Solirubrum puertoriconensis]|uniref:Putative auto-transporter adhesin head GIN domain-containing protein n=1 Tax=Solirubrum puertoriconensis TaxID=1751427 RepID=A0A9X0L385_SOLP1|nr:head GIN domain-containing protein [Solirubrum puertoriconensis]KUG06154.1 hypothetical protein ASU33_01950 [Solirubrum puertoriconensis]
MKTLLLPLLTLPLAMLATLPVYQPVAAVAPVVVAAPEQTRDVRQVPAFTRLSLATSAELILVQGATQKVELVGNPDDLREIETAVKDGRLRIGLPEGRWKNWGGFKSPVKVYVTMPQIEALGVSGSGSIRAEQPLRAAALDLSVSGSGALRVPVTAERLQAHVSGSGSMRLSGNSPAADVHISGSGRIDASELKTNSCTAHISGSGNCRIGVAQTLDARISGSGSVYYTGSPRITSRISGSGRVTKV